MRSRRSLAAREGQNVALLVSTDCLTGTTGSAATRKYAVIPGRASCGQSYPYTIKQNMPEFTM